MRGTICLGSQSKNFCSSDVAWIGSIWQLLVLRDAICISAEVTNSTNKLKLVKKKFLFVSVLSVFAIKQNTFYHFNAKSEASKKCFLSIKFNILPACVVPPFERFNAFLIWAGSSNGVHELCFDTLCRFPPRPLSFDLKASLMRWGHCVHAPGSHKAGIVSVAPVRWGCSPAAGREDPADSRGRSRFDSVCYFYALPPRPCIGRRRLRNASAS